MVPPADLDRLSHAELKGLVIQLFEMVAELQRTVAAQRDEIARLKGGPGRPAIKPSGMEKATEPKSDRPSAERPKRGPTRTKLTIHEERIVKVPAPSGARFKGYTSYIVQDLVLRVHIVEFRCERWVTSDGTLLTAPLPDGIEGHFGPELRRFILAQYHQGQVTVPRLVEILQALGIFISKRQLVRLLNQRQDRFLNEANAVLRAGLSSAAWITVDDTGARHQAKNGFCTSTRRHTSPSGYLFSLAQGMPVVLAVFLVAGGPRVRPAPGIPCLLFVGAVQRKTRADYAAARRTRGFTNRLTRNDFKQPIN